MKKKIWHSRKKLWYSQVKRGVNVWDLGDKCTVCVAVLVRTPVRFKQSSTGESGGRKTWEDRIGRNRTVCKAWRMS